MHTPQTIELNGPALKAEAEKSHEFLTLVYYGANRDRNREITDIEQMRKGIEVKHKEDLHPDRWIEAFKKLEDMGMGALIMGRRGNPNRFRWNYSLKAIGQAAMNGEHIIAHRIVPKIKGDKVVNDYNSTKSSFVSRDTAKRPTPTREDSASKRQSALVRAAREQEEEADEPVKQAPRAPVTGARTLVYIPLRPDYAFEAELPNLTPQEADAICAVVRRCVK